MVVAADWGWLVSAPDYERASAGPLVTALRQLAEAYQRLETAQLGIWLRVEAGEPVPPEVIVEFYRAQGHAGLSSARVDVATRRRENGVLDVMAELARLGGGGS